MDQKPRAEFFAELEQRVLASRKRSEALLRNLNEVFYSAERAKREIARSYHQRRLQRLSRSHTT